MTHISRMDGLLCSQAVDTRTYDTILVRFRTMQQRWSQTHKCQDLSVKAKYVKPEASSHEVRAKDIHR